MQGDAMAFASRVREWSRAECYHAQCRHSSLIFYRAVRDRRPPWALEELRTMGVFHWERGPHASRTAYTPSEALLYAIVHDHRAYARHLLGDGPCLVATQGQQMLNWQGDLENQERSMEHQQVASNNQHEAQDQQPEVRQSIHRDGLQQVYHKNQNQQGHHQQSVQDHETQSQHHQQLQQKLGPPSALAPPGPAFGASHLATAVRYDRVELLLLLLRVARHCSDSFRLSDYVNAAEVTPTWGPGAGRTPLHLACQLAKPECTRILLAHGARADVADMQGEFPLDALLEPLEGPLGSSKREGNGGPVPPGCRACQINNNHHQIHTHRRGSLTNQDLHQRASQVLLETAHSELNERAARNLNELPCQDLHERNRGNLNERAHQDLHDWAPHDALARARCLELLLLFSPPGGRGPPSSGSARALLERAPERWCALLGTETWMRALGRSPPSLRACALRELLRGGERARGAMLDSLPIRHGI
ncbi:ankyrin repeat domain-containing protein 9 [Petromyzon marinus]|uniref:ankyrin repeat domain-containing protein 9 n=1 Tax=Petromyzon marinus TaxID=7757 RepID=UPI003F709037